MDVKELITQSWEAVKQAGIPKELHKVAFREAIAYLKAGQSEVGEPEGEPQGQDIMRSPDDVSEDKAHAQEFFKILARESGESEANLRNLFELSFDDDGEPVVDILPPTRKLGNSRKAQAQTVVALVAPARGIGLGEDPIVAQRVRDVCKDKRCYDGSNFASRHVKDLQGTKLTSRTEMEINAKWVPEFQEAVTRVLDD